MGAEKQQNEENKDDTISYLSNQIKLQQAQIEQLIAMMANNKGFNNSLPSAPPPYADRVFSLQHPPLTSGKESDLPSSIHINTQEQEMFPSTRSQTEEFGRAAIAEKSHNRFIRKHNPANIDNAIHKAKKVPMKYFALSYQPSCQQKKMRG